MTRRSERISEAIRRLAGEIIHTQLKDPRINGLVTVTRVEMAPDLKFAKIYYTTMCEDKKKKLLACGLRSAKSYIRKRIAEELELRYAPNIALEIDETIEHSDRINEILHKLNKEATDESNKKNSAGD